MTDGGRTGQMDLLGDARLLGAVRSLAKPFRLDEMLAIVDELTRTKEAKDAGSDREGISGSGKKER
jgi:DNA-binding response OmpR family regulator